MDASSFTELNDRDCFLFGNCFGSVGFANGKNGIANHLRTQRKRGTNLGIGKIMQGYTIPASMQDCKWDDCIASAKKRVSQFFQLKGLVPCSIKLNVDCTFHCPDIVPTNYFKCNIEERQFLPVLKDWVSLPSKG